VTTVTHTNKTAAPPTAFSNPTSIAHLPFPPSVPPSAETPPSSLLRFATTAQPTALDAIQTAPESPQAGLVKFPRLKDMIFVILHVVTGSLSLMKSAMMAPMTGLGACGTAKESRMGGHVSQMKLGLSVTRSVGTAF